MSIRRKLALAILALAVWALGLLVALAEVPVLSALAWLMVAAGVVGALVWVSFRLIRRLLWRVGRRLAFSYFLIGVLPIPMVLLLLGLGLYLQAGFFLSHLYRDGVRTLETELAGAAAAALAGAPTPPAGVAVAIFRGGKRVAGDELAPTSWPGWLPGLAEPEPHGQLAADGLPLAALADGRPTVVAGARVSDELSALAFTTGDLAEELVRRTRLWVELTRPGDPSQPQSVRVQVFGRSLELSASSKTGEASGRAQFFSRQLPEAAADQPPRWIDRPVLFWVELHAPLRALASGETVAEALTATLNATPRGLVRRLYSGTAEVDTAAWAALFGISVLLAEIYLAAVAMAIFMIFSLSRAVNRMSRATEAVQAGDFAVRIPTKRKDQLGDLQRSFNRMAENLESLVATAAQKEALETELALAREVQQSLLPTAHTSSGLLDGTQRVRSSEGTELGFDPRLISFATHFAPSAAIGGDYYDILPLDATEACPESPGRVAVMIADVSGHGLSAGLRMAMLKSALTILVEDGHTLEATFMRLDGLVRQRGDARGFVTATLGLLDLRSGALELINAAHPPTYLLRGGEVREITLPSRPLGGASRRGSFGRERVALHPDDVVLWLSDGLVEAVNGRDEPFGYERLALTLSGAPPSATATRDRLLRAVREWCGSREIADDQTLVVMRWVGGQAARV